ncbi:polysaccharide deacetylase family protein [Myxococcota bacterium]|nr:polysaccharide deacetylase family protein [Myxococcota bacterium]
MISFFTVFSCGRVQTHMDNGHHYDDHGIKRYESYHHEIAKELEKETFIAKVRPSEPVKPNIKPSLRKYPDGPVYKTGDGRPYQVVLLSFDSPHRKQMWDWVLKFASEENIKFTFFVSGVYMLEHKNRGLYRSPDGRRGNSEIGFSRNKNEIVENIYYITRAYREGHEIASHANGHFSGKSFSLSQWNREINQFSDLLRNVKKNNRLDVEPGAEWEHIITNMKGFRAPHLAVNGHLYRTLAKHNYRYDASRYRVAPYWPQKYGNIWFFPLGVVPSDIIRKKRKYHKHVIAMDHNFYMYYKNVRLTAETKTRIINDVFMTYLEYFNTNYYGARAPISIGHHFVNWHDWAYWEVMKLFAKTVCSKPEVICTTHIKLLELIEKMPPGEYPQFCRGTFPKLPRPVVESNP